MHRHQTRLSESESDSMPTTAQNTLDLKTFINSQENVDALYSMFSKLLDRKIDELKKIPASGGGGADLRHHHNHPSKLEMSMGTSHKSDDIQDDYLHEKMASPQPNASTMLTNGGKNTLGIPTVSGVSQGTSFKL